MAGIALSCNVQITSFELRILFYELIQEFIEVLCNSSFRSFIIENRSDFREASANRLVDIKKVSIVVPRVGVLSEGEVIIDSEGAILIENSKF